MPFPPRGTSQLRKGRVSLPGTIYFITKSATIRLEKEAPYTEGILMGEGIPEIIADSLKWLEEHEFFEIIAYVIMADHIHLLFQLSEKESLQKVMLRFGAHTGREIAQKLGQTGHIWQNTYYDRAIRSEEELSIATTYIIENPIKAGYAETSDNWRWLYLNEYRGQ